MSTSSSVRNRMRMASLITAINVLVASGFAITGIVYPEAVSHGDSISGGPSLMFAMYAAARTIPLAIIALAIIYKNSAPALIMIGTLAGAIQLSDALIGILMHDPMKVIGPLMIAGFQFYAIFMLTRLKNIKQPVIE